MARHYVYRAIHSRRSSKAIAERIQSHCARVFGREEENEWDHGRPVSYVVSDVRPAPRGTLAYPDGFYFQAAFAPGRQSRGPKGLPPWITRVYVKSDNVVVTEDEAGSAGHLLFRCIDDALW